jgi:hypothetical protein
MAFSYSEFVLVELPEMTQEDLAELKEAMQSIYKDLCHTSQMTKSVYLRAQISAIDSELLIRDCKLHDVTSYELRTLQKSMAEDIQIQDAIDIVLMRRGEW